MKKIFILQTMFILLFLSGINIRAFSQGNALAFDGSNDFAQTATSASLAVTNQITMEVWAKTNTTSGQQELVRLKGANDTGIELVFNSVTFFYKW